MDCQTFEDQIAGLVDGTVGPEDPGRPALEAHLVGCAPCREELVLYRRTVDLLAHLRQPEMPETFWRAQASRVMRALRPIPVWSAPPLSLLGLLIVSLFYLAHGLELVGTLVGDVLDASIGPFRLDESLTLVPVYSALLLLAFFTVSHDEGEESAG